MHSIMILADPLSAAVFMLTDFHVRAVRETDSAPYILQEVLSEGHDIVFVTETLAGSLRQQIREVQKQAGTLITVIPGVGASRQLGKEMLTSLRRSVIGQ